MERITKNQKIDMLLGIGEVASNPMLVEFLNHEKDLNSKKNSSSSLSKTQKENIEIRNNILEFLKENAGTGFTASQIGEKFGFSNQKASALLKQLVDTNEISKVHDKKVSLFTVEKM